MSTLKNYFLKGLPFLVVGAAILVPHSSNAAIIWSQSKNIEKVNGTDFWTKGTTISSRPNLNLLAFNEAQNVLVNQSQNIKTNKKNPNYIPNNYFANYDPSAPKSSQNTMLEYDWDAISPITDLPVLTTNTYSSHFVYIFTPGDRSIIEATLVLDAPIVGLIGDPWLINQSNSVFFPDAKPIRWNGTLEGLNWYSAQTRDYVKVTGANNNILQIRLTSQGFEPLRVITAPVQVTNASVPEPLTIFGCGTAISFATFFKRKLAKKKEKN